MPVACWVRCHHSVILEVAGYGCGNSCVMPALASLHTVYDLEFPLSTVEGGLHPGVEKG